MLCSSSGISSPAWRPASTLWSRRRPPLKVSSWAGRGGSGPPASQPCLGPSLVCPPPLLQLTLRPQSSPAAPRKGNPRVWRPPAPRRLQAVDTAPPLLSSSPSTSGRALGWGPRARLQGIRPVTTGPLSPLPTQGVPLHVRGAHLAGLPRQARHHGPGGKRGCQVPILPRCGLLFGGQGARAVSRHRRLLSASSGSCELGGSLGPIT